MRNVFERYIDTLARAPLYVPEVLSSVVTTRLAQEAELYISPLTEMELCSALALKVRQRRLHRRDAARALSLLTQHRQHNRYAIVHLTANVFESAATYLRRFSTPLRTLDALQLACCAHASLTLFTADRGMRQSARHLHLAYEWAQSE